jgi:hypothetical protein
MKLYSHKAQYPTEIPFRIKLSNGITRTDPSTFTPEEIADAGYIEVEQPPAINNNQILSWDFESINWVVRDKTPEELQSEIEHQWNIIRQDRDTKIQEIAWRYERYARHERLNIAQIDDINIIDQYIQDLADIPQTQSDPFNIVWPTLNKI